MHRLILALNLGLVMGLTACFEQQVSGTIVTTNTVSGTLRHSDSSAATGKIYLLKLADSLIVVDSVLTSASGSYSFDKVANGTYTLVSDSADVFGGLVDSLVLNGKNVDRDLRYQALVRVPLNWGTSTANNIYSAFNFNHASSQFALLKPDTASQSIWLQGKPLATNIKAKIDSLGVKLASSSAPAPLPLRPILDSFVDSRDGQLYHTAQIGAHRWMVENMKWLPISTTLYQCPQNNPSLCSTQGVLYSWAALPGTFSSNSSFGNCPSGYRLPLESDYKDLVGGLGGINLAAFFLRSQSGWNHQISNPDPYGIGIDPLGYVNASGTAVGLGSLAALWSVSAVDSQGTQGYALQIDSASISFQVYSSQTYLPIRCLQ